LTIKENNSDGLYLFFGESINYATKQDFGRQLKLAPTGAAILGGQCRSDLQIAIGVAKSLIKQSTTHSKTQ